MDQAAGLEDVPQHAGERGDHPRAGRQPGPVQRLPRRWPAVRRTTGSREFVLFFLACVVVAGVYGAYSVNKRIFFVQAMPALLALLALHL